MATPVAQTTSRVHYIPQGRRATRAFGVVLEKEHIDHWCKHIYEKIYGEGSMSQLSKRKYNNLMSSLRGNLVHMLKVFVYEQFPNLPRLRRSVVLLNAYPERFLFVFKDDSSPEAFNITLKADDVKGAREFLGIQIRPKWFHVVVE